MNMLILVLVAVAVMQGIMIFKLKGRVKRAERWVVANSEKPAGEPALDLLHSLDQKLLDGILEAMGKTSWGKGTLRCISMELERRGPAAAKSYNVLDGFNFGIAEVTLFTDDAGSWHLYVKDLMSEGASQELFTSENFEGAMKRLEDILRKHARTIFSTA
jgi:hypothetical protein